MSDPKYINNAPNVPGAIGTYSQATVSGNTIFVSGQIGIDPATGELAEGFEAQAKQVFQNFDALAKAAGGTINSAIKLNVFLTDMKQFADFNKIAEQFLVEPYPARALIEVAGLPKGAVVEIEGILHIEARS